MKALPERGRIGIFNRSYYEDVLVVQVHPELLDGQQLPAAPAGTSSGRTATRTSTIRAPPGAQRHARSSSSSCNVSKEEQKQRFLERLDDPEKTGSSRFGDLEGAAALGRVPGGVRADAPAHQHEVGALVGHSRRSQMGDAGPGGRVITNAIEDLKLKFPKITPEKERQLAEARQQLDGDKPETSRKRGKRKTANPSLSQPAIPDEKMPSPAEEEVEAPV